MAKDLRRSSSLQAILSAPRAQPRVMCCGADALARVRAYVEQATEAARAARDAMGMCITRARMEKEARERAEEALDWLAAATAAGFLNDCSDLAEVEEEFCCAEVEFAA